MEAVRSETADKIGDIAEGIEEDIHRLRLQDQRNDNTKYLLELCGTAPESCLQVQKCRLPEIWMNGPSGKEDPLPSLLGLEWFHSLGLSISGIHQIQEPILSDLVREFNMVFTSALGTKANYDNRSKHNSPDTKDSVPAMEAASEVEKPPEMATGSSAAVVPSPASKGTLQRSDQVRRRPAYLQDYECTI